MTNRYGATCHFETSALNDPKVILNVEGKGTAYMFYQWPQLQNSNPFRYRTSRFRVTGHFEKSAPKYLKIILNAIQGQNMYICSTRTPESQIPLLFVL